MRAAIAAILALCLALSTDARRLHQQSGTYTTGRTTGPGGSSGVAFSATDPVSGTTISAGFQAAQGTSAGTALASAARSPDGTRGAAVLTGTEATSTDGGRAGSISSGGTFATRTAAGGGTVTAGGVTGRGAVQGYGLGVAGTRDPSGVALPGLADRWTQGAATAGSAGAVGQGARASVGGITTVTPAGTGSESVTAASTTSSFTFGDVVAGTGLPRLFPGYGTFSGSSATSTSAVFDGAATSFGAGYGYGQSYVQAQFRAGVPVPGPAPGPTPWPRKHPHNKFSFRKSSG